MESANRDAGLTRVVGPIPLAASMVSIVVGAGIFLVPAELGHSLGSLAPLAMLVCAVAIGAIAVCMAEGGSRVPSSGGVYAFIVAAFGQCAGYVAGTLFCVSNVLACGAVSSAFGDAVAGVLPPATRVIAHGVVATCTVAAICALNIGGIERGMRLVSFSTVAKLVPLAVFIVVGAFAIRGENFARPETIGSTDVGHALLLTLFAFQGVETSLSTNGELRDPARSIPRALLLALSVVTLLYLAVQVVAQGILGASLGHSTMPLADAMGRLSPILRALLLLGAVLSMFGWLASDLVGSPRILFAFGRDGMLPRALGRLSRRGHAPYVAIIFYGALAIALALSGTFVQLAAPATLALATLYIAACMAAWQLARRGVAQAGTPLGFRWLSAAAVIGVGSMLAMIVLAPRTEILGLLVLIGLSLLGYFLQTRVLDSRGARQPAV